MKPLNDPLAINSIRERTFVLKIKLSALRDDYVRDFLPGAPALADEASAILDELLARLGLEPLTERFPQCRQYADCSATGGPIRGHFSIVVAVAAYGSPHPRTGRSHEAHSTHVPHYRLAYASHNVDSQ